MVSIKGLLIIFLSPSIYGWIILPTKVIDVWKPIDVNTLKCPLGVSDRKQTEYGLLIPDIKLPVLSKKEVKGYLCHNVKWVTECYESFFGVETITFKTYNIKSDVTKCQEAIADYKNGILQNPYKPVKSCGWMKTNVNEQKFQLIKEFIVKTDPYSELLISPEFLHGSCNNYICETIYDSVIWISENKITWECEANSEQPLHTNTDIKEWSPSDRIFIYNDYIPPSNLKDACKINYCKNSYIRLNNGYTFSLPTSTQNTILQKFLDCPKDFEVKVKPHNEVILLDKLITIEDIILKEKCEDILKIIKEENYIKRHQLGYFNMRTTGVGKVYRFKNNTLEVNLALHKYAKRTGISTHVSDSAQNDVLGESEDGKLIMWNEWVIVNETHKEGPNGIYKQPGEAPIYPFDAFLYNLSSDEEEELQLNSIEHPIIKIYKNKLNLTDQVEVPHYNSSNIVETVTGWTTDIWENLTKIARLTGLIIGIFIIIVITVIILKLIFQITKLCNFKNTNSNMSLKNRVNQNGLELFNRGRP